MAELTETMEWRRDVWPNEECPNCKAGRLERDEVDIGVGVMCGPARCLDCGWSEQLPEFDLIDNEEVNEPDIADRSTHGPLTIEKLAAMLLEDIALANRRPGSWEGANMSQVLHSHGYWL